MDSSITKTVVILRGPSGSGKSTKAKELVKDNSNSIIHSVDDYFITNGEYNFNPSKLGLYHKLNYNSFLNSLSRGINLIIIDNTNLTAWEYEKYMTSAKEHEYKVVIYNMPLLDAEILAERNVHGVSLKKIKKMIDKYKNSLLDRQ